LLGPADEYLVYGYATCTRVKFILVIDGVVRVSAAPHAVQHAQATWERACAHTPDSPAPHARVRNRQDVREDALRETFRRMHSAFIEAVSNPWQPPGKPLVSAAFGRAVDALARASRGGGGGTLGPSGGSGGIA
jgi:hypothetical protein